MRRMAAHDAASRQFHLPPGTPEEQLRIICVDLASRGLGEPMALFNFMDNGRKALTINFHKFYKGPSRARPAPALARRSSLDIAARCAAGCTRCDRLVCAL